MLNNIFVQPTHSSSVICLFKQMPKYHQNLEEQTLFCKLVNLERILLQYPPYLNSFELYKKYVVKKEI